MPMGVGAEEFEQLYRQWWADLVALCRRMLGRVGDAEDAAQEAFMRAWVARDQYSSSQPYWPWLATIALRLCVDWQRRGAREPAPPDAAEMEVGRITPERVVVASAELEVVFEALDDLRGRDRRALVLHELAGWPYQRIAEVEGMTVEAVRGSLKRTRAVLRRTVLRHDVFDAVPRRAQDLAAGAADLEPPVAARRLVAG